VTKTLPAFRTTRLASGCLLTTAILAGCGGTTFVPPPDTSTADRPAAYTPATQGTGGLYYGTHFRYVMPSGWQSSKPPSADVEVWMKQQPLSQPEPIIGVTAFNSPDQLPVEAYASVSFHNGLTPGSRAIGGITTVTVDSHTAQSYEISSGTDVDRTIIIFRGGVAYTIQFAAPSDAFAAAAKGPFSAFLASWRWN
jgi:hypothetical protein